MNEYIFSEIPFVPLHGELCTSIFFQEQWESKMGSSFNMLFLSNNQLTN